MLHSCKVRNYVFGYWKFPEPFFYTFEHAVFALWLVLFPFAKLAKVNSALFSFNASRTFLPHSRSFSFVQFLPPNKLQRLQFRFECNVWQGRRAARPFLASLFTSSWKSVERPSSRTSLLSARQVFLARNPSAVNYIVKNWLVLKITARSSSGHCKFEIRSRLSPIPTLSSRPMIIRRCWMISKPALSSEDTLAWCVP